MINASEATRLMQAAFRATRENKSGFDIVIENCYKTILQDALAGNDQISFCFHEEMSDRALERLESDGFRVRRETIYDERPFGFSGYLQTFYINWA